MYKHLEKEGEENMKQCGFYYHSLSIQLCIHFGIKVQKGKNLFLIFLSH